MTFIFTHGLLDEKQIDKLPMLEHYAIIGCRILTIYHFSQLKLSREKTSDSCTFVVT